MLDEYLKTPGIGAEARAHLPIANWTKADVIRWPLSWGFCKASRSRTMGTKTFDRKRADLSIRYVCTVVVKDLQQEADAYPSHPRLPQIPLRELLTFAREIRLKLRHGFGRAQNSTERWVNITWFEDETAYRRIEASRLMISLGAL